MVGITALAFSCPLRRSVWWCWGHLRLSGAVVGTIVFMSSTMDLDHQPVPLATRHRIMLLEPFALQLDHKRPRILRRVVANWGCTDERTPRTPGRLYGVWRLESLSKRKSRLEHGARTALIGPTGPVKPARQSDFGTLSPSDGDILLDGISMLPHNEMRRYTPASWRTFQSALFPMSECRDNLRLAIIQREKLGEEFCDQFARSMISTTKSNSCSYIESERSS